MIKKAAAAFLAVIMTALIFTGCSGSEYLYYFYSCFYDHSSDPLVVSHRHASDFAGTWADDNKNVIDVGLDDDTIGYIDCTATPNGSPKNKNIGDWRIDYNDLTVYWHSSLMFDGKDEKISQKITYVYANDLSDDIIEQGKDAIQEVYDKKDEEHQWYASDKYLCLDDLVFTYYKE